MTTVWVSFACLHIFVCFGWLAKKIFNDELHERTLVIISIYFLQPLLIFWGLLIRPLDTSVFIVPLLYLVAILIVICIVSPLTQLNDDPKDQAILKITGIISNTGNLGIPFGLLIFGEESVPYMVGINFVNTIVVLTLGSYTYSRGQFSVKESLINVLKLPVCWAAMVAMIAQKMELSLPLLLSHTLEMGAYAAMVLQLMLYGLFVASIHSKHLNIAAVVTVQVIKFIVFPLIVYGVALLFGITGIAMKCLILQSIMPIAVNTMNLAALYECYPKKVAMHALISSGIALIAVPIISSMLKG